MSGVEAAIKSLFDKLSADLPSLRDIELELLRNLWPVPRLGKYAAVTLYDDVCDVLGRDRDFPTDYNAKLDVITGGQPFFLGLPDGPAFHRDVSAMRQAMPPSDIPGILVPATLAAAQRRVDAATGSLEIVGFVRDVTFESLCGYFGTPEPRTGDMKGWAQTLFKFLFADMGNDPALRAQVDVAAPALQAHVDSLIAARKADPGAGGDDVLSRALKLQAQGVPGLSDIQIRTALVGFIVAGLPQPAMAAPQALNQLLNRPKELAAAQKAARTGDNATLGAYFFEALRFDPLAPFLMRRAGGDQVVGAGTGHQTTIPDGTLVFALIQSAMMDGRHVENPNTFNPKRPPSDYLSFGFGLHTCFAKAINEATIPLMLKPVLAKPGLRRAPGAAGQLVKSGPFAQSLVVNF
ncbi:MAG: cytochrome P450 [Sphingomonas sp.]